MTADVMAAQAWATNGHLIESAHDQRTAHLRHLFPSLHLWREPQ